MKPNVAYKFMLALCATLSSQAVLAAESDFTRFDWRRGETSDDFRYHELRLEYRSQRHGHFWPYQESGEESWDWGFTLARHTGQVPESRYSATRAKLLVGHRLSHRAHIEADFGLNRLSAEARDGHDSLNSYRLTARYSPDHRINITAEIERDLRYLRGLQPGGFTDALSGRQQQLSLTLRPWERLRFNITGESDELSDGNRRRQVRARLMYGISPGWPSIWAGISGERMTYDEERDGYWSPEHYNSFGLSFESGYSLDQDWTGNASISLSRARENRGETGNGSYLSLGLEREIGNELRLRLEYNHGASIKSDSHWWEHNLNARLMIDWD